MSAKNIILDCLSSGHRYLSEIHNGNPDTSLDDLQTAAWAMIHAGEISLGKDWKLSITA